MTTKREELCVKFFDLEDEIRALRKKQLAIKKELNADEEEDMTPPKSRKLKNSKRVLVNGK